MELEFNKYHGAGNDFILMDGFLSSIDLTNDVIHRLCDRHYGIGADGLIIIKKKTGFDFEMRYFNADGFPGSMCGNGGRCAVQFAFSNGYLKEHCIFEAVDGVHRANVLESGIVSLQMNDVESVHQAGKDFFVNTGSPHYVQFVENLETFDVYKEGKAIRNSDQFRVAGTNVNFIEWKNNVLFVRTYERGVEDETLSCGTGVTASVLVADAAHPDKLTGAIKVKTRGGELAVRFKRLEEGYSDIWLEGPAVCVFKGRIKI